MRARPNSTESRRRGPLNRPSTPLSVPCRRRNFSTRFRKPPMSQNSIPTTHCRAQFARLRRRPPSDRSRRPWRTHTSTSDIYPSSKTRIARPPRQGRLWRHACTPSPSATAGNLTMAAASARQVIHAQHVHILTQGGHGIAAADPPHNRKDLGADRFRQVLRRARAARASLMSLNALALQDGQVVPHVVLARFARENSLEVYSHK